VKTATGLWSISPWHGITGSWITSKFLFLYQRAIRCVDVISSETRISFSPFWINPNQNLRSVIFTWCKYNHRDFRHLLVRNSIDKAGKSQDRYHPSFVRRRSTAPSNVIRLDSCHNKHWPANRTYPDVEFFLNTAGKRALCKSALCVIRAYVGDLFR
jgi:hypothetical protein